MGFLKIIRLELWAGLVVALVIAVTLSIGRWHPDVPDKSGTLRQIGGIGGPFALIDQHDRVVTERDFLGKPFLVFFGFTHCPDVCPTALLQITQRLHTLGSDADKLNVLFITVDPERDTPSQLKLYLSSFDPRIIALSGTAEQVDTAAKAYKAYYRKVPIDGGSYTMDHTATVYLMDAHGRFVETISHEEADGAALAKLKRLIGSP